MIECTECNKLKNSAIKNCPEVEIIIHGHVQYKEEMKPFIVYESIIDKTKNIQDRLESILHDTAVQIGLSLKKR
ncbi:MAG: hypothetical protein ACUZ8I_07750 [Candidatus Scalindua sp.]